MKLPAVFERYRKDIDNELLLVFRKKSLSLYDMMRYHMGWIDEDGTPLPESTGKALRPTLCLMACEAVSGHYEQALPAAAAVELVHNFSLIHDDVQDDDRERRHRPTVWSIWGKPQAINAGTGMRILASHAIRGLGRSKIPLHKQARLLALIDETTLRLIEGQYLDISFETRMEVGIADYLEMIEGKTSALIACSLQSGALVGSDDEKQIATFGEIGRNLEIAFQIRDDIFGIWGRESTTGKPEASDIYHKKKTLPLIHAMAIKNNGYHEELRSIYACPELKDDDVKRVLKILNDAGSQSVAQAMVETYSNAAIKRLEALKISSKSRTNFEEVIHFLAGRSC